MIPVPRDALPDALSAQVPRGLHGAPFTEVFTDTRSPIRGGLFFALRGERFDAHEHLHNAIDSGAAGLVISRPDALPDQPPDGCLVAVVDDQHNAVAVRRRVDALLLVVVVEVLEGALHDAVDAAVEHLQAR